MEALTLQEQFILEHRQPDRRYLDLLNGKEAKIMQNSLLACLPKSEHLIHLWSCYVHIIQNSVLKLLSCRIC